FDRARRRIAAGAREHGHASVGAPDDDLDDAAMLVRGQRRILAGGAARDEKIDAAVDLKIDEAFQRRFVERAAVRKRSDEGCAEAFEFHDMTNSSKRNNPLRPRSSPAAMTAPRAKPSRPRARCEISMRSSGESKKRVCRPNSAPTREETMDGSSLPPLPVFAAAAIRSAVPLGASSFCEWCRSSMPAAYCGNRATNSPARCASAKTTFAPGEKFDAYTHAMPALSTRCRTSSNRSFQPVVPMTRF